MRRSEVPACRLPFDKGLGLIAGTELSITYHPLSFSGYASKVEKIIFGAMGLTVFRGGPAELDRISVFLSDISAGV